MWLRSVILALLVCVTSGIAQAQPIQGIYLGAGAGVWMPFSTKATAATTGIGGRFDIRQSPGYDAQISVGYGLGNGWRFELEGTFDRGSVSGFSRTTFPAAGGGAVRNWGIMANALFDLDVGSPYVFPYVGLGMGYQSTRLDNFVLTRLNAPFRYSASGEAGGFAAQAIGGVAFPVPNVPGLSITADYRIMDILGGASFSGAASSGGAPTPAAIKLHNQFDQAVIIGFRFAFDVAPPAAGGTK